MIRRGVRALSCQSGWRPAVHWIALAIACLLPLLLYLPFLTEPFNNDEGFYASVGQLILHGGLPYRDAFDNKPPVVFGWYALSFLFFGEHVWAPRLLVSVLVSLTVPLVYLEAKLLFGRRAGLIAAFAFSLSIGVAKFQTNANTEYFMLLPMTGALLAFTVAQRGVSLWPYAVSGFFNGIAIMTKEPAVFPFAFLVAWLLVPAVLHGGRQSRTFQAIVLLIGGCTLAVAGSILPFVLLGAFGDFWDAAVKYTLVYVGASPPGVRIGYLLQATIIPILLAGPWVLLSLLATRKAVRSGDRAIWFAVGWLSASGVGIAFVGRYFWHYNAQLLPGLSLLVPIGLISLTNGLRRPTPRAVFFGLGLVLASFVTLAFSLNVYLREDPSARHQAKFGDATLAVWETQSQDLAQYVADNTRTGDYIYNLGFQSELYFYADRRSPTRYMFDRPFWTDNSLVDKALDDLAKHMPVFIVDSARYESFNGREYERSRFDAFLAGHYEYIGKLYYADVYRLKPTPPP